MHRITTTLLFFLLALAAAPSFGASCLPATPSSPIEISFETGLEGFTNEVEAYPGYSGLDYFQRNGPSPTTGPTTGMEGTGYLYLKFPGGTGPNDWAAALYSPCFDLTQLSQPQLIMSMFVRNPQILSTFIQVSIDGGLTWLYPPSTTPVKYRYPGQRETGWVDAVLDLSPYAGAASLEFRLGVSAPANNDQEVAFDYVRIGEALCTTDLSLSLVSQTTTGNSDGAIDLTATNGTGSLDYSWSNGATTEDLSGLAPDYYGVTVIDSLGCYNDEKVYVSDPLACNGTKSGGYPYSYDFENNGLGLLKQNQDDDTNWRRRTGDTPTQWTGPQSWQPFPYGSQYRHIEAGNGNNPKVGVLSVKKCLNLTNLTQPVARIDYHLYGQHSGDFAVEISGDGGNTWQPVFRDSGNQGWFWKTATVDLSGVNTGQTRVRYVGRTAGTGPEADIAVDGFYLGEAANAIAPPPASASKAKGQPLVEYGKAKATRWFDGEQAVALAFAPVVVPPTEEETPSTKEEEHTERVKAQKEGCFTCVLDTDLRVAYPNPAGGNEAVSVRSESPLQTVSEVQFLNSSVTVKASMTSDHTFQFQLPNLASGVHFARVMLNGEPETIKLVVIR